MTKWQRIRREIAKRLASKWGWGAIACGATAGIVTIVSLTDDRVSLREPKPLGSFIFDDRSPGERIGPVSLSKGLRRLHRATREWTPTPIAPELTTPEIPVLDLPEPVFDDVPLLAVRDLPVSEIILPRGSPYIPSFYVRGRGERPPRPTPTPPPPPGTPTQFSSPVPEISSWLMLLIGFGSIGFGMRRRYRTA